MFKNSRPSFRSGFLLFILAILFVITPLTWTLDERRMNLRSYKTIETRECYWRNNNKRKTFICRWSNYEISLAFISPEWNWNSPPRRCSPRRCSPACVARFPLSLGPRTGSQRAPALFHLIAGSRPLAWSRNPRRRTHFPSQFQSHRPNPCSTVKTSN